MAITGKKKKETAVEPYSIVRIEEGMKSHADDSFFVEKERRGKELLDKYGLPKDLKKNHPGVTERG